MGKRTPLYETHVASGAKIVDFGGWDMPLNYGSQIEEHHAVRSDCRHVRRFAYVPVDFAAPMRAPSCASWWPTT